jgi:hypothetical protein
LGTEGRVAGVQDLYFADHENSERRGHGQPSGRGLGERLEATARKRDVDLVDEEVRPVLDPPSS